MQPLDRCVFGPYKKYYNTAANEWMLSHPSTPITIYNVAELAGKAYTLAFSPSNIPAGFRITGIWPVNENIFGDDEFLGSAITDRKNPETEELAAKQSASEKEVRGADISAPPNKPSTYAYKSPH